MTLLTSRMVGFLAAIDRDRATAFYRDLLGFEVAEQQEHAIVLSAGGTSLRISVVSSFDPQPFTVLGWEVEDIDTAVDELGSRGVVFDDDVPLPVDRRGICTFPNGDRVAWFHDPDGNNLSVATLARPRPRTAR